MAWTLKKKGSAASTPVKDPSKLKSCFKVTTNTGTGTSNKNKNKNSESSLASTIGAGTRTTAPKSVSSISERSSTGSSSKDDGLIVAMGASERSNGSYQGSRTSHQSSNNPRSVNSSNRRDISASDRFGYNSNGDQLKKAMSFSESGRSNRSASRSESKRSAAGKSAGPMKKAVVFSDVYIREYERIVGDNPSCSGGAPISIGWAHTKARVYPVDIHEAKNPDKKIQIEMVMTRDEREKMLLSWGYKNNDIAKAARMIFKIKNQRRQTIRNAGSAERIEEGLESVTRRLKQAFLLRSNKKKVKEMQRQAALVASAAALRITDDDSSGISSQPEEERDAFDNLENLEVKVARKVPRDPVGDDAGDENDADDVGDDHGENDDNDSYVSGFTLSNGTTASELEMEEFYQDLELELFGEDLPDMVGQTLECPGVDIPEEDRVYDDPDSICGMPEQPSECSSTSEEESQDSEKQASKKSSRGGNSKASKGSKGSNGRHEQQPQSYPGYMSPPPAAPGHYPNGYAYYAPHGTPPPHSPHAHPHAPPQHHAPHMAMSHHYPMHHHPHQNPHQQPHPHQPPHPHHAPQRFAIPEDAFHTGHGAHYPPPSHPMHHPHPHPHYPPQHDMRPMDGQQVHYMHVPHPEYPPQSGHWMADDKNSQRSQRTYDAWNGYGGADRRRLPVDLPYESYQQYRGTGHY